MRNEKALDFSITGAGFDPLKFHRGGLIEHVHVEAADVDIPDTFEPFDLYLHFNDFKNSIKVDKYGTFTLSVDNTGDGSLTKDFSWITLSSSANAADENGKSSLAMGTVIKTTSFKLDDQEYSLDSNETSVQAGSFVKFDYYKNVWGVTNHINNNFKLMLFYISKCLFKVF